MKNREIKFRAWDKKYNVMLCTGFNIIGEVSLFSGVDVMLMEQSKKHNDDTPSLLRLNDVCIMQFTGLKTKSGKDIYEGDILGGYPHGQAEVRWQDKAGCWEAYWVINNFDEAGEPFDDEISSLLSNELSDCFDEWDVIGNIYSNPELLTTP